LGTFRSGRRRRMRNKQTPVPRRKTMGIWMKRNGKERMAKAANITMDDLKNNFEPRNIAVALACDGNRRKELNMIKKSKGFSWGSGAISCAY
jgi:hypothetical protein